MKNQRGEILLTALLIGTLVTGLLGAFATYKIAKYQQNLGAFRPSAYSGKLLTRLNEGGAESTFNTTPGTAADDSTLTTAKLGDFIVFTINPGASNEEKISVSAVSVSGTTATWTIINRGLSYTENVAVTANKKQHAIGETVIISNDDHYTNVQYVNKDDAESITGIKTFSNPPLIASSTSFTASNQVINKQYADDLAIAGAPDSSLTVKGLVETATSAELSEGTTTGGTTAPLVARSTSFSSTTSANTLVPVTQSSGKLKQGWLDLTESFTFSGGITSSATSTLSGATSVTGALTATSTTFTAIPTIPSSTPSNVTDITSKNYVDGLTYWTPKIGNTTKDISSTSTTTIAHGLGRTPRLVRITAFIVGGAANQAAQESIGAYNGTTHTVVAYWPGTPQVATTAEVAGADIILGASGSVYTKGVISIDATNITITWTKTSTPTGTAGILWEAY